ncbi:enoyl-CoA hydratase/isomerase family protein [Castellaniella sp. GW247-6E4]|uniref:enoyl-CoA hydratase/isomerase family protein n=1 Tax=Castellaniella sp. GW247-6E4 TaxID=3140380 RepID=UPI0033160F30
MYAAHAGVVTLTLDRPDKGNALSPDLVAAVSDGLKCAVSDPAIHTLVLRGEGRNFCTGFDLSDLDEASDGDLLDRFVRIELLLSDLWHAPLRTVALGHGQVVGAGADLFVACDLRLALEGTRFRFPGAGFGLVLGTRRLAERVGVERALAWVGGSCAVECSEAVAGGLVSRTVTAFDARDWAPPSVDRRTFAALRAAARRDERDRDLAALVRSAAGGELQGRVQAYRDRMKAFRKQDGGFARPRQ